MRANALLVETGGVIGDACRVMLNLPEEQRICPPTLQERVRSNSTLLHDVSASHGVRTNTCANMCAKSLRPREACGEVPRSLQRPLWPASGRGCSASVSASLCQASCG